MNGTITPKIAVAWIRSKEPIAAGMNFHLGLTGSVLFKGESRKDFDVIAYPHDPAQPFDKRALIKALDLSMDGQSKENFENYADKNYGRNVAVCTNADGIRVDLFFMQ
jgi:hypothetical protein